MKIVTYSENEEKENHIKRMIYTFGLFPDGKQDYDNAVILEGLLNSILDNDYLRSIKTHI